MIIDCFNPDHKKLFSKIKDVRVDGLSISYVYYLDTFKEYLYTYDVMGDGKIHSQYEEIIMQPDWFVNEAGLYAKKISGRIDVTYMDEMVAKI